MRLKVHGTRALRALTLDSGAYGNHIEGVYTSPIGNTVSDTSGGANTYFINNSGGSENSIGGYAGAYHLGIGTSTPSFYGTSLAGLFKTDNYTYFGSAGDGRIYFRNQAGTDAPILIANTTKTQLLSIDGYLSLADSTGADKWSFSLMEMLALARQVRR